MAATYLERGPRISVARAYESVATSQGREGQVALATGLSL
jgi:hypothetical protein